MKNWTFIALLAEQCVHEISGIHSMSTKLLVSLVLYLFVQYFDQNIYYFLFSILEREHMVQNSPRTGSSPLTFLIGIAALNKSANNNKLTFKLC